MSTIVAVGGHSGDSEVMSGALLRKYIRHGHRVVLVGLTTGDGGHPTLSRPEYRIQKDREAREAASVLGAECRLFPYSSGSLAVSNEMRDELAGLLDGLHPDAVITHWRDSVHTDHAAAHCLTVKAMDRTGLSGKVPLFFGDNWEDRANYTPDLYVSVEPEDVGIWEKACSCYQFFRDGFYNFPYRQYYRNNYFNRGAEARKPLAAALMRWRIPGIDSQEQIPEIPL